MRHIAKLHASVSNSPESEANDLMAIAFGSPFDMSLLVMPKEITPQAAVMESLLRTFFGRKVAFRLDVDHITKPTEDQLHYSGREGFMTIFKFSVNGLSDLELSTTYVPEGSTEFWPNLVDHYAALRLGVLEHFPRADNPAYVRAVNSWTGFIHKAGEARIGKLDDLEVFDWSKDIDIQDTLTDMSPILSLATRFLNHFNQVTIVQDEAGVVKLEVLLPSGEGNPFSDQPEVLVLLPELV